MPPTNDNRRTKLEMRVESIRRSTTIMISALNVVVLTTVAAAQSADHVAVDAGGYSRDCGIAIRHDGPHLEVRWALSDESKDHGYLTLDLRPGQRLISALGISSREDADADVLLKEVDPVVFLTVGSRQTPPGKPPGSKWQVFFDKPADRPHETFRGKLVLTEVKVESEGRRAAITLHTLTAGSFTGALQFVFYSGCPLVQIQAVLSTHEDSRAIIYDAALVGRDAGWKSFAWVDPEEERQTTDADGGTSDRHLAVKHRTIVAEADHGSIACFPPPHQYFFPRDLTTNLSSVWIGRGHAGIEDEFGFGIRNDKAGGGAFVPWFNAPPDTAQRLSVFYLLSRGNARKALDETLRYTHGDRFEPLDGYLTFTSHWHMAVAVSAMERKARGDGDVVPDWVRVFKDMGVNMVHLADFHGDGHQFDPGPLRLAELAALFAECRRLSDERLLVMPGEEVNTFLGLPEPGRHSGHWMSLFPRPVAWIMQREANQPFVTDDPQYGKVYRVGSRQDVTRLIDAEQALVWSAHPRNKASSWTPDIFRHEDFYLADSWLGAAWKAMPADLSERRLGTAVLALLDDMANWGQHKYMPGEVDVFKIDHTHELYGHMNVNYLRLDHLPRFDDGWHNVLDTLRTGQFFVTTGEILIPSCRIGGKLSGETLTLVDETVELRADVKWTFPLAIAEVVSGDGQRVYRESIDVNDTGPFGNKTFVMHPRLKGRNWVRFEVWDIAANGAFTQPVWIANR